MSREGTTFRESRRALLPRAAGTATTADPTTRRAAANARTVRTTTATSLTARTATPTSRTARTARPPSPAGRTVALWLIAAAVSCMPFGPRSASAQEPESGRDAFAANGCYQCHGYAGQGGVAGPRIAPSPYPLEAFAALVRRPANVMPAYAASVLGDDDLAAIYAYVRSVPEPPPIEDIAALR